MYYVSHPNVLFVLVFHQVDKLKRAMRSYKKFIDSAPFAPKPSVPRKKKLGGKSRIRSTTSKVNNTIYGNNENSNSSNRNSRNNEYNNSKQGYEATETYDPFTRRRSSKDSDSDSDDDDTKTNFPATSLASGTDVLSMIDRVNADSEIDHEVGTCSERTPSA